MTERTMYLDRDPIDNWLARGKRGLIHGVDFNAPPGVFLRFLRGQAKKRGVAGSDPEP
ncbi:hypothetical protein [Streptomyces antimycoticus]